MTNVRALKLKRVKKYPQIDKNNGNDQHEYQFCLSVYTGKNDLRISKDIDAIHPFDDIKKAIKWAIKEYNIKGYQENKIQDPTFESIPILDIVTNNKTYLLVALDIIRDKKVWPQ